MAPTPLHGPGDRRVPLDPGRLEEVLVPPSGFREPDAVPRASVAAVFSPGRHDIELLFIQRAVADGDPWSGQMAFPGGRYEAHDASSMATAARETWEEIGLDLSAARLLGSLSHLDGGRATNRLIMVSGHCFWLDEQPGDLELSDEVAAVVQVPVHDLLDRQRYIEYLYPHSGLVFPGIQLDHPERVIWGLTLRFLGDLFERLEVPFLV